MTDLWFVLLGAAVGAPARHLIDRAIQARHPGSMPWGTMVVNIAGTGLLGLLVGVEVNHDLPHGLGLGVGIGLCGTLTTFSTFAYESLHLFETGARARAVLNVTVALVAGLVAATLGYVLGSR